MPRICIVTDIHHGAQSYTKLGPSAERLMAEFVTYANDKKPDLIIDMGDRISDIDHTTDLRLQKEATEFFAPLQAPVAHICGNHDVNHLSVQDNENIIGQSLSSEIIDIDDWQLIIWRPDTHIYRPGGFVLPESDLLWLAATITQSEKPTAVFTHVPLSGHRQLGNYYFQNNSDSAEYPHSTARVLAILSTARVPLACFAGHVHWNSFNLINGQPHFTLQSLTESFTTTPQPAGAYALLELNSDINWRVFGKDQLSITLPAMQTTKRWIEPLNHIKRAIAHAYPYQDD